MFEGQDGGKYSGTSINKILHRACDKSKVKRIKCAYFKDIRLPHIFWRGAQTFDISIYSERIEP
jgi:hypothetical protein